MSPRRLVSIYLPAIWCHFSFFEWHITTVLDGKWCWRRRYLELLSNEVKRTYQIFTYICVARWMMPCFSHKLKQTSWTGAQVTVTITSVTRGVMENIWKQMKYRIVACYMAYTPVRMGQCHINNKENFYFYGFCPLSCMGVKLGRWYWGRNVGWGC